MEQEQDELAQVPAHMAEDGSGFCSGGEQMQPNGRCRYGCDHADHYSNDGHPECEEQLPLSETVARARNSSLTDPSWRADYR